MSCTGMAEATPRYNGFLELFGVRVSGRSFVLPLCIFRATLLLLLHDRWGVVVAVMGLVVTVVATSNWQTPGRRISRGRKRSGPGPRAVVAILISHYYIPGTVPGLYSAGCSGMFAEIVGGGELTAAPPPFGSSAVRSCCGFLSSPEAWGGGNDAIVAWKASCVGLVSPCPCDV